MAANAAPQPLSATGSSKSSRAMPVARMSKIAAACAVTLSRMKAAICPGSMMIDWAKMTGMTPAVLMRSGRCVVRPVSILRPTMRRAYCTGMRLWPCVIRIVSPVTATETCVSR